MEERKERGGGSRGPQGVNMGTLAKLMVGAPNGSWAWLGRGELGAMGYDGDGDGDEYSELGEDWMNKPGGSKASGSG
jgi:hypothetical protein